MEFKGVIVGLGNPEEIYKDTRHNFGTIVVHDLIHKKRLSFLEEKNYYKAWNWNLNDEIQWMVCKTKTYMNVSGLSVKELCKNYGFSSESFLILHDELDLDFGKLRFKFNGGTAGHKGLESVVSEIGKSFYRLRLGIGKPKEKDKIIEYVLSPFSSEEKKFIPRILDICIKGLELFCIYGIEKAMNLVHSFSIINKGENKSV